MDVLMELPLPTNNQIKEIGKLDGPSMYKVFFNVLEFVSITNLQPD